MISLDQVLILEQKVESAVKKITQLQAENDALRSKCAELTNALSSKSEQLTSFEQDQGLIESKIKHLIDRFSNIENSVMDAISQSNVVAAPKKEQPVIQNTIQNPAPQPIAPIQNVQPQVVQQSIQATQQISVGQPVIQEPVQGQAPVQEIQNAQPSFFDMNEVNLSAADEPQPENGEFDIF